MVKYFLFIFFILILFYKSPEKTYKQSDLSNSSKYLDLTKKLELWSNQSFITTPSLHFRLNRVNSGSYSNGTIYILVKKEELENDSDFLLVALAHEFGHHYLESKMINMTPEKAEFFCDFVSIQLVGLKKTKKILSNQFFIEKNDILLEKRINFIKNNF